MTVPHPLHTLLAISHQAPIMKNTPGGPKPFRGFVHIGSEHASSRTTPRIPRDVCELPLTHLELTPDQHTKIREKYENNQTFSQTYDPDSVQDQIHAASILASNRLDLDARESLENKWNVRWSVAGANHSRRVLYQWYAIKIC